MSREVIVYTQREAPLDLLLDDMGGRGTPVVWKPMLGADRDKLTGWQAGYLFPESDGGTQVTISRETVEPEMLEEMMEGYSNLLTEQQRQALLTVTTKYQLTLEGSSAFPDERVFVGAAFSLVELGDGLIYDIGADRFYDPEDYRSEHAELLKDVPGTEH